MCPKVDVTLQKCTVQVAWSAASKVLQPPARWCKPVVAAIRAVAHSKRKHQLQRRLTCMWRRRLGLSRICCTLLFSCR
jgi:hypothetical protein